MINIKYIHKIHNCNSTLEVGSSLNKIEKQLNNMLQNKNVDYIKDSQVDLYITLIVNPTKEELSESHKHTENIYSVVSKAIDGDAYLYSVRNRLGHLSLPNNFYPLLIAIGLTEYSLDVANDIKSQGEEGDETPIFYAKDPKWSFDDVILNTETRERILRALSIIENREQIFNDWGFSSVDKATKSILCFYGPAGTGKTMTAEAIGNYLQKSVVHSSYAEIESKWVGEGAKNLHAIFKFAEEHDSVLFFDEADSFLSSRIENTESSSDKHYNRMSNELFQLLEEFNGCVIFSTNLLKDVDEAFKSRIIDSIKFELPDNDTRILLIKRMLPKQFPFAVPLSEENYQNLSNKLEGFSGRDIRKSILLSLADAAQKKKRIGTSAFTYDDITIGFDEVLAYKRNMLAENGIMPTDVVDNLVHKQKLNENIIDIAIYAMLCDGVIHEKEKELLDQLSMALLGVPLSEPIESPQKTVEEICNETKNIGDKKVLLETAIRVVCIDGFLDETEKEFINQLIELFGINSDVRDKVFAYVSKLTALNKDWGNILFSEN